VAISTHVQHSVCIRRFKLHSIKAIVSLNGTIARASHLCLCLRICTQIIEKRPKSWISVLRMARRYTASWRIGTVQSRKPSRLWTHGILIGLRWEHGRSKSKQSLSRKAGHKLCWVAIGIWGVIWLQLLTRGPAKENTMVRLWVTAYAQLLIPRSRVALLML